MAEVVLDASAILAYLLGEPGADVVAAVLLRSLVSPVNVAEVIGKLIDRGFSADAAEAAMGQLGCEIVPVDAAIGREAGRLHEQTHGRGVSLGDRFCLSLSARTGLPAMSADRAWKTLGLGVEITLIR
jgi:ribonuclease VapC